MKALALFGSAALFLYIVGFIGLTAVNISRATFSIDDDLRHGFWARQALIIFWPLVVISTEGRNTFALMWNWKGEDE